MMENDERRFKNYMPDEWALQIISQKELDLLKSLEQCPFGADDVQELLS